MPPRAISRTNPVAGECLEIVGRRSAGNGLPSHPVLGRCPRVKVRLCRADRPRLAGRSAGRFRIAWWAHGWKLGLKRRIPGCRCTRGR